MLDEDRRHRVSHVEGQAGEDDATSSSRGGGGRTLVLVASLRRARVRLVRTRERACRRVLVAFFEATGDGDSDGIRVPFVFAWQGHVDDARARRHRRRWC